MGQNKLLAGFMFIFLLQSPLALAITCNSVSSANYNSCMEILNSAIAESEKEILISNLDYQSKLFPDHDYVFDINTNKKIKSAPEGIQTYNREFIQNAWIDIFALMPSVLYNNTLYSPEKISILTGFNYELEIPRNYYSPNYPQTKNGDCKTKYYIVENEAENKIYANGKYANSGDLIDIFLEKDSEIKSEYTINLEVEIKHYKWDRYCSSRDDDGLCRKYSEKCEYEYTETKKESLKISDTLSVKLHDSNIFAEIEPINIHEGSASLKINYNDSVWVDFKESKYHFNKFLYSIDYSKPPYYINTLKAEDYNREEIINLFIGNNILTIKDTEDCKITAFDFFNIFESDCNSNSESLDFFIKTDKLKYQKGDKIKVSIFPDDVYAEISYGDMTKTAKGYAEFTADYYENKIVAEHNGLKSEKVIYIINKERLLIIWNLTVFVFLNYFLYAILRKYSKKIK
jgi:hypothetical protein